MAKIGIFVLLVTVRKRSYGKVMFSQACVKNSVHRSRHPLGIHPLGRHPPGRHPRADITWADTSWADTPWADILLPWADTLPPWADTPYRQTPLPTPGRQTPPPCPLPPPQQMATAVGGKHPTGMHSCKLLLQLSVARISVYHDEFHFV